MTDGSTPEAKPTPPANWVVWVTLGIVLIVVVVFVLEFVTASANRPNSTAAEDQSRMAVVEALDANPANAEALIVRYGCAACHRNASAQIAPQFIGIAERAGERDPELSAFAYLYQSITDPAAHIVEDYTNAMPANYGQRLTDQELADLIAYLLSDNAE